MTDPLANIRARIDAGQRQLTAAIDMLCNADQFRQQSDRLGFPIDVQDQNGRIVLSFDDPTARKAAVLTSPQPMDNRHLDDAGKPWPAKRDDHPAPEKDPSASEPDCGHEATARVHSTGETECASCRENVSGSALPPIRDPRGNAVPPAGKRRWTEEDEADLVARLERGEPPKEIAAATGRHVSSVNGKITYVRTRKVPAKDTEVTTPPAEPVVAEAAPPPVEVTAPAADDEPDEDGWTRADELELLRLWNASRSPRNIADGMGRSIEDVLARRVVLVPSKQPRDVARLYHERLRVSMEVAS